eukprot:8890029-Lingulodinium_polyedra.AAC.1
MTIGRCRTKVGAGTSRPDIAASKGRQDAKQLVVVVAALLEVRKCLVTESNQQTLVKLDSPTRKTMFRIRAFMNSPDLAQSSNIAPEPGVTAA